MWRTKLISGIIPLRFPSDKSISTGRLWKKYCYRNEFSFWSIPLGSKSAFRDCTSSGARFSNSPKLFGWRKSLCIFNKNTVQHLELGSYFTFPYISKTKKSSFSQQANHSFKNCFSGPMSNRVFQETHPRRENWYLFSYFFPN